MKNKTLAPIHPGKILKKDFMKPSGISCNRLACYIFVPANRISEIVAGRRSITADTALRLSKCFGASPEVWMGLQADYDLRLAKQNDDWREIEQHIHIVEAS